MEFLNLNKEQQTELLNLRKDTVLNLVKSKNLLNHKARVALVLDHSGSMSYLYDDGTVQAILEKILPIALEFDDNGTLDVWAFENGYTRLPSVTEQNYHTYINDATHNLRYGGTKFAPVMSDVKSFYMEEEPDNTPVYVIFITDGENFDGHKTTELMKEYSNYPIFWQFVGIGDEDFVYLNKLDDMGGRYVDNADFFEVINIPSFYQDDNLYNLLLDEYPNWYNFPEVQEMLKNPSKIEVPQKPKKKFFGLF